MQQVTIGIAGIGPDHPPRYAQECRGTGRASTAGERSRGSAPWQDGTVDIKEARLNHVMAALPFEWIKPSGINRCHGKVGVRPFSNITSIGTMNGNARRHPMEVFLRPVGTPGQCIGCA